MKARKLLTKQHQLSRLLTIVSFVSSKERIDTKRERERERERERILELYYSLERKFCFPSGSVEMTHKSICCQKKPINAVGASRGRGPYRNLKLAEM